jgi:dolichol-phosphate mannosyltransferase
MRITIVIPVYNEFSTFREVLDRVRRAPLPEGCTKEIIVVDDASADGTGDIVREYEVAGLLLAHHSTTNLGKGSAIRTAMAQASGDVLLIQDGDLEYDPRDYAAILQPIVNGAADVVYGSRFLGTPFGMALPNRIANRILTAVTNLIYGARLTDQATAYKAFRLSVLRELTFQSKRFEFCAEVTAKLLRRGYRIHEVPIRYNARGIAEGKKIRASDGVEALWTLLKHRF